MAKMTDEEMAQADAAYDVNPGVEPDFWSFRTMQEIKDDPDALASLFNSQVASGAVFHRMTEMPDGIWVEGWLEQPRKQAAFNPPYTLDKP